MSSSNSLKSFVLGTLVVFAWGIGLSAVGAGIGYYLYIKSPAVYQSVATILVLTTSSEEQDDSTASAKDSNAAQDDSKLIVSVPVVQAAIESANLQTLPELAVGLDERRDSKREASKLIDRTGLFAQRMSDSTQGVVYQLKCAASRPDSSARILSAVVESFSESVSEPDRANQWSEAVELLAKAQRQAEANWEALQKKLEQLEVEPYISLFEGTVFSKDASQLTILRQQANQLAAQRDALQTRIRKAESLIAANRFREASTTLGDSALDAVTPNPLYPPTAVNTDFQESPANSTVTKEELDRRLAIEQRRRLEQEVENQLKPLQEALDELLTKVGNNHPRVRGIRASMASVRKKLDDLPEIPGYEGSSSSLLNQEPEGQPESSPQESSQPDRSAAVDEELRSQVEADLKQAGEDLQALAVQLEETQARVNQVAGVVAGQKRSLEAERRLLDQMQEQESQARALFFERMEVVAALTPEVVTRVTQLQPASRGVQVSPNLSPYLGVTAGLGLVLGLALGGLILLTSTPSDDEPVTDSTTLSRTAVG